ncbi:GNAT family N-acetyltransferase [Hymenobacter tenuis]
MPLLEVTTPEYRRQFLDLPFRIYQNHPNWIGPLDHEIEAVFDPKRNHNFAHGEAIRWILTSPAGEVIGRVAAFINHQTPQTDPTLPVGGMGFFECIEDQQAANELFEASRLWLSQRGLAAMDGPINFGERDRFWGLLTAGFTEPNYGMFYHAPYYQQLFENYGFQVYFKQYTCYREVATPLHETFGRAMEKYAQQYPTFRFEHASKRKAEKLAQDFHHVYNLAWANHSGINPMPLDKARELVREMKPVLDERLLWFAYHNDEPIAFFVSLPELNQIFKHIGRKFGLVGKLRFLWEKRKYMQRTDKKLFGVIFGVVPEWQGKGIESAMMVHARAQFMRAGYHDIEMNWIGDFNPRMLALTRSIGARIYKTHITYRYLFDRTRPFERSPIIR